MVDPRFEAGVPTLAGVGPGLTPFGDDVLTGYVAGQALLGEQDASAIAELAARRTTALSATLLRHAATGELAEPAHALVLNGDIEPLLCFGSSSGVGIALGLALAFPPKAIRSPRRECRISGIVEGSVSRVESNENSVN